MHVIYSTHTALMKLYVAKEAQSYIEYGYIFFLLSWWQWLNMEAITGLFFCHIIASRLGNVYAMK